MKLYKHVLTVVVLSPIESPDMIERRITESFHRGDPSKFNPHAQAESIEACTRADNRMSGPSYTVPERPIWDGEQATLAAHDLALDTWADGLPCASDEPEAKP